MKPVRCLILALVLLQGLSLAQKTEPGLYADVQLGAMLNPLGSELGTRLYCRWPFMKSDHLLLASSHLDLGLDNRVTPAFGRLMLFASFEPLAILDFSAHIGYMRAYKALGFGFVSLPAYEAPYGQEAIDTLTRQDRRGLWTDATARLKAAFPLGEGKVVATHAWTVNYLRFGSGEGYFYERQQDVVFKTRDYSLIHDTMLGYKYKNLLIGVDNYYLLVPRSGQRSWTISGLASYQRPIGDNARLYAALLSGPHMDKVNYDGKINTIVQSGITFKLK